MMNSYFVMNITSLRFLEEGALGPLSFIPRFGNRIVSHFPVACNIRQAASVVCRMLFDDYSRKKRMPMQRHPLSCLALVFVFCVLWLAPETGTHAARIELSLRSAT
jgi:hypothetical protein